MQTCPVTEPSLCWHSTFVLMRTILFEEMITIAALVMLTLHVCHPTIPHLSSCHTIFVILSFHAYHPERSEGSHMRDRATSFHAISLTHNCLLPVMICLYIFSCQAYRFFDSL